MCVLISFIIFMSKVYHCKTISATSCHKFEYVFMQSAPNSCSIVLHLEFFSTCFGKRLKLLESPSLGAELLKGEGRTDRQRNRHDETNIQSLFAILRKPLKNSKKKSCYDSPISSFAFVHILAPTVFLLISFHVAYFACDVTRLSICIRRIFLCISHFAT